MRILHVIPTIDPVGGGPNACVRDIASLLAKKKHSVTVCYTFDTLDKGFQQTDEGVAYKGFPTSFPKRFSRSREMLRWLRHSVTQFDVVQIHSIFSVCSLEAGNVCSEFQIPYIVRPHGSLDPYDLKKKILLKKIFGPLVVKKHVRNAFAIHCTSELEAERLETFNTDVRKTVISLPVQNDFIGTAKSSLSFRKNLGLSNNQFVILFMSRIHPKKNLPLLIETFRKIVPEHQNIHLAIAGQGSQGYENQIRESAQDLVQQRKVSFCGFLQGKEKHNALLESDVFVLPSQNENFGVAVVEALQAGLPVIVSDQVYISREIHRANAGLICRQNAEDIALQLRTVIADGLSGKKMLQQLSKNAKSLAKKTFDEQVAIDQLINLYQEGITAH